MCQPGYIGLYGLKVTTIGRTLKATLTSVITLPVWSICTLSRYLACLTRDKGPTDTPYRALPLTRAYRPWPYKEGRPTTSFFPPCTVARACTESVQGKRVYSRLLSGVSKVGTCDMYYFIASMCSAQCSLSCAMKASACFNAVVCPQVPLNTLSTTLPHSSEGACSSSQRSYSSILWHLLGW